MRLRVATANVPFLVIPVRLGYWRGYSTTDPAYGGGSAVTYPSRRAPRVTRTAAAKTHAACVPGPVRVQLHSIPPRSKGRVEQRGIAPSSA